MDDYAFFLRLLDFPLMSRHPVRRGEIPCLKTNEMNLLGPPPQGRPGAVYGDVPTPNDYGLLPQILCFPFCLDIPQEGQPIDHALRICTLHREPCCLLSANGHVDRIVLLGELLKGHIPPNLNVCP